MVWKIISFVTVIFFWLALYILLTKWPRFAHKSISKHSAAQRQSYIFFSVSQTIVGILTLIFMFLYFLPHFNLSWLYYAIYTVVAALQLISTWLPDTETGKVSYIHKLCANIMAFLMFIVTAMLAMSLRIPFVGRMIAATTAIYMMVVIVGILTKVIKPYYLYLQVIYVVTFQVCILAIAVIK